MSASRNTVSFITPGKLNLDQALIFGLSAKEENLNPIGYFGTGLKYAIAIALKLNHQVTIFDGENSWEFSTREITTRGKVFQEVVRTNLSSSQTLPCNFTTELGKNWEPWMGYRELASNTKDEGGEIKVGNPSFPQGWNSIQVTGEEFYLSHLNHKAIFLEEFPRARTRNLEIFSNSSPNAFYRRVKVATFPKPFFKTYSQTSDLVLTEDRTIKSFWDFEWNIRHEIGRLAEINPKLFQQIITCGKGFWEDEELQPTSVWVENKEVIFPLIQEIFSHSNLNSKVREWYIKNKNQGLVEVKMSEIQAKQVKLASEFLASIGHAIPFQIYLTHDMESNCLGQARDSSIWLSPQAFSQGTKCVAKTIFEEYCHLKYGVEDCDYSIQHLYLDTIMTLGEQLRGEPL